MRADMSVSDTVGFLAGEWDIVREIRDHRSGQDGTFRGRARFLRTGNSDRELAYTEEGELGFGGHRGPAHRSLLYRALPDGSADVRFADGREFFRLDLRSGHWQAEHPCRADRYVVHVTRLAADSFTETWQVTGPDKDYDMTATYNRNGAVTHTGVR